MTSMLSETARDLLLFHTVVAIIIIPVDLASGKLIRCSEISISDTSLAGLQKIACNAAACVLKNAMLRRPLIYVV